MIEDIKWNTQQQEAVEAVQGAVMVLSCAGSGKTSVLLERTRRIVEKGAAPGRVLVATFSRAAARELEDRYRACYGGGGVRFSTIHSVCYSVLAGACSLTAESILTEQERRRFFLQEYLAAREGKQEAQREARGDFEEYYQEITSYISLAALTGERLAEGNKGFDTNKEKNVLLKRRTAQRYAQFKKNSKKVDFDDMIVMSHRLLTRDSGVLEYWQGVFDYLMIDEYQDTSAMQAEIFFLLAAKHGNICVVGDDDQCIYGFRGADSRIFRRFQERFPACRIITLDVNYRSLPGIVDRAARLIVHNKMRFRKDFWTYRKGEAEVHIWKNTGDREQIAAVLKGIENSLSAGRAYRDIAVLYRVRREAATLVNRLLLEDIPFYIKELPEDLHKGLVFQDVLAYYRLAVRESLPGDLERIINRPKRYIKKKLLRGCPPQRNLVYTACSRDASLPYEFDRINDTVNQLFLDLRNLRELAPARFMGYLKEEMKYPDCLKEYAEYSDTDEEELLRDFATLQAEAVRFGAMKQWLEYAENSRFGACMNPDGVYLSTFHGAKGLQWQDVFIISANEGITPYRRRGKCVDIEEERRLFYVAATRAMDKLCISCRQDFRDQRISGFAGEMGQ